jgi:hypothetical protein
VSSAYFGCNCQLGSAVVRVTSYLFMCDVCLCDFTFSSCVAFPWLNCSSSVITYWIL